MQLYFTNHEGFDLKPGDQVFIMDWNTTGVVYIKRKENGSEGGIYSASTGKLILKDEHYDDLIHVKGKTPIEGKFSYTNEYLAVVKDDKVGACSMDGRLLLLTEYKDIMSYRNGLFIVKAWNDKYALFNDSGKLILPAKFNSMEWKNKNFLFASNRASTTVVASNGEILLENARRTNITVSLGWQFFVYRKGDKFELYNTGGKIGEYVGKPRHMSFGYFEVTNGSKKYVVYVGDGSIVIPEGDYVSLKKRGMTIIAEDHDGNCTAIVVKEEKGG